MTINAQNRLLPDWFARVRTRQTVLPRFQRFEAWGQALRRRNRMTSAIPNFAIEKFWPPASANDGAVCWTEASA